MIEIKDLKQLTRYFPDADWENLFWGFVCHSRQKCAGTVPMGAKDELMLGIQHPEGGCLCEMAFRWYELGESSSPRLEAFSESWPLLRTPTLQAVLKKLMKGKETAPTPEDMSRLLIKCGFVDQSDKPLDADPFDTQKEQRFGCNNEEIRNGIL